MNFLYQDKNWLVVNKPTGISTHRAHEGDLGLVEWIQLHHGLRVRVCSRLDKGTSGVLSFALTPEAVAKAQTIHEKGSAKKHYLFIAKKCSKSSWSCTAPLDGKLCETHFTRIQKGVAFALYEAVIHRGRTHQIRRHAAASGIPLLGDEQYKGSKFVRLALHCTTVHWPGINQALTASPPQWFTECLDGLSTTVTTQALVEKSYPFLAEISNCCRLIHRREYPDEDIVIDKYQDWLCVTGFDEQLPAQQLLKRLQKVLDMLTSTCNSKGVVVKTNLRDPHKRKLFADIAYWGDKPPESFLVHEHDLHFIIQLNDRQHVGLFLDQRDSRSRIAGIAKGKRVANLFAFTCSFSVYALAAGAEVVFSVDLAAGCLRQGKENIAVNQLADAGNAKFIKEDVRKWLARQLRKKHKDPHAFKPFDIIICDPPVFASAGKGKSFHVEKDWPNLVRGVGEILKNDGIALFSNNHQAGSESFYYETLTRQFTEVTRLNPPCDFPQVANQAPHVRIYWCRK